MVNYHSTKQANLVFSQAQDPALQDTVPSFANKHEDERRRPSRSVTFGKVQRHLFEPHPDVPVNELWYSTEESHQMKKNHKVNAKFVARSSKSLKNEAVHTLYQLCQEGGSLADMMDSQELVHLQAFVQDPQNNGLLTFASHAMHVDKRQRRRTLWNIVDELQDDCSAQELADAVHEYSHVSVALAQYSAQLQ